MAKNVDSKVLSYGAGFASDHGAIPPEPPGPDDLIKDIHRLAERVCLAPYEQRIIVAVTATGQVGFFDCLSNVTNAIAVTVYTGQIDVWLGDDAVNLTTAQPDFRFTAVGVPQQIMLTPRAGRRISWGGTGAAATGKIVMQAL